MELLDLCVRSSCRATCRAGCHRQLLSSRAGSIPSVQCNTLGQEPNLEPNPEQCCIGEGSAGRRVMSLVSFRCLFCDPVCRAIRNRALVKH